MDFGQFNVRYDFCHLICLNNGVNLIHQFNMNQTIKQGSKLMRKVLFLEVTGFLSLIFTGIVMYLIVSMRMAEIETLLIPGVGMLLVGVFTVLTIRYARRDLHKIHELHTKPFYRYFRYLVYVLGVLMVLYPLYLVFAHDDFFETIGVIMVAEILLVLGVFTLFYNNTLSYLIQNEHLHHKRVTMGDIMLVVVFPIALVAGSTYWLLSKEASTVSSGKADFESSAASIIREFESNDSLAAAKYVGKTIKFGGVVQEIAGDSAKLVKIQSGVEDVTVNCGFDKSQFAAIGNVQAGDSLIVQCSCSGYTSPEGEMDLLSERSLDMARCALILKAKDSK